MPSRLFFGGADATVVAAATAKTAAKTMTNFMFDYGLLLLLCVGVCELTILTLSG